MSDQPSLFDLLNTPAKHLHSESDSRSSKAGAESVAMRSGSQKAKLLEQYADGSLLTDDEAANLAGLLSKPGCCWWHRCSDLRKDGLIEATGYLASPLTGEMRMVCEITDAGLAMIERMKK